MKSELEDVRVTAEIVGFLESRSARGLDHIHGNLLEHLCGTCALLREWGNPDDICHAGLCHAVYGTSGFTAALLDVKSDRDDLAGVIGRRAEALVYFYASCDRAHLYPQIGTSTLIQFRDRFNGEVFVPDASLFASFVELTFANELDILCKDQRLIDENRPCFGGLFARCRPFASVRAFAHFVRFFGVPDASPA